MYFIFQMVLQMTKVLADKKMNKIKFRGKTYVLLSVRLALKMTDLQFHFNEIFDYFSFEIDKIKLIQQKFHVIVYFLDHCCNCYYVKKIEGRGHGQSTAHGPNLTP